MSTIYYDLKAIIQVVYVKVNKQLGFAYSKGLSILSLEVIIHVHLVVLVPNVLMQGMFLARGYHLFTFSL